MLPAIVKWTSNVVEFDEWARLLRLTPACTPTTTPSRAVPAAAAKILLEMPLKSPVSRSSGTHTLSIHLTHPGSHAASAHTTYETTARRPATGEIKYREVREGPVEVETRKTLTSGR